MSVHDRWGGRRTGDGRRWEVRWRDRGTQRKRRFSSRAAADAWNATVTLRPGEGRVSVTVGELWEGYRASKAHQKASYRRDLERGWELYVDPRWGAMPVDAVTVADIREWLGGLTPANGRRSLTVLSGLMQAAAERGHVPANPCAGLRRPRAPRAEVTPLSREQVAHLAEAAAPHGLVVWVLAVTGVRLGELCGLRVGDLDVKRRRLLVARSRVQVGGEMVEGAPKSGLSREVPLPEWLVSELAGVAGGRRHDAPLLVTRYGGPWRPSSWYRVWGPAREAIGRPDLRVHDLRHTAAVMMLEAGVQPRTVQAILGHADLSMTLDLYGRWTRPELDSAADVWDMERPPSAAEGGDFGRLA